MDEPTSALNHAVQEQVLTLLQNLQKKYQLSYVFISLDFNAIKAMRHRLLVLKQGAIIESGDCLTLLNNPQQSYTPKLIRAAGL